MNQLKNKIKEGLLELKPDSRDFKLGKITVLPKLEELPEEFILGPVNVKNQLDTSFCTQMATCGMSELQEGMELEPSWSYAVSQMINPTQWGQDMRTALKVHVKYGAIEKKDSPFDLEDETEQFLQDIDNWPKNLFTKAEEHRKKSFFTVDGPYDHFDNIRASIYRFRDLKRAVGIGFRWVWDLEEAMIPNISNGGVGHMVYVIGWTKKEGRTRLIIQNSYGKDVGDKGKHYFPREIVNETAERYGIFMFVDLSVEIARKTCWSLLRRLIEWIKRLFK